MQLDSLVCKLSILGVWGLGFGVWGLGFGVWGLGFLLELGSKGNLGFNYLVSFCYLLTFALTKRLSFSSSIADRICLSMTSIGPRLSS